MGGEFEVYLLTFFYVMCAPQMSASCILMCQGGSWAQPLKKIPPFWFLCLRFIQSFMPNWFFFSYVTNILVSSKTKIISIHDYVVFKIYLLNLWEARVLCRWDNLLENRTAMKQLRKHKFYDNLMPLKSIPIWRNQGNVDLFHFYI